MEQDIGNVPKLGLWDEYQRVMNKGANKTDQPRVAEIIDQVKEILDRNLNHREYRLYLYGSRATGAATAHADIDLAVISPSEPFQSPRHWRHYNLNQDIRNVPKLGLWDEYQDRKDNV